MAITCLAASSMKEGPRFVWNASSSVSPGLYRIHSDLPRRGQLALVQLPPAIAALALERGYLKGAALLLKPLAATNGDRVCRAGRSLFIRGRKMADIRALDAMGRPLPSWHGCRVIGVHEVFLLSAHPSSFDSRYFGPIAAANIIGAAQPIWASTPSTR
ncbi:MAG: S26 family signal peptidase [Hyphomicrobiaceae bacterium]